MSYRLKLRESLVEGVRRVALDQIEFADAKLRGQEDAAVAVHDARRCLKRLRALLRLVRLGLDEEVYRREAKRLATTGRLLAGARDQHVMMQTLSFLEARYGSLPDAGNTRIAQILSSAGNGDPEKVQEARRRALSRLGASRKFFAGPAIDKIEMQDVLASAEKVYRKARRMRRRCHQEPTDEGYHSWRKSVQQHWRHMQLLSRAWPDELGARSAEAKELSQLLGQDHDLSVLAAFASSHGADLSPATVSALEKQCRTLQEQLRVLADLRGARLLAETPQELTARLASYWDAARKLSSASMDAPLVQEATAPAKPKDGAEVATLVPPPPSPLRKRASA